MVYKRYHNPDGRFVETGAHNNVQLPAGVEVRSDDPETTNAADELYERVGERFPVTWHPWASAEPIIDTDDLPEGVTEADVESVLSEMKADGVL